MASMNKVYLMGNLVRDPEMKFLQNSTAVCNFSVALNRKWKSSGGEWKDEVTFVRVESWGKQAEACGEYLKKGSPVLVEGRLKLHEWEKDGQKRTLLCVVAERVQFLNGQRQDHGNAEVQDGPPDEDIPF